MTPKRALLPTLATALLPLLAACGAEGRAAATWTGTMDTLPSGEVVVHNTDQPMWPAGSEWRAEEDLRIGTMEGNGPDLLGNVRWMEVDPAGRIWVLEGQAQEIRIFGPDGSYVKTVGREGGGPGEFAGALHIQLGPDGNMWVVDPQNNRVSLFDTSGTFVESKLIPGGFMIIPWPGGFDAAGYQYGPVPLPGDELFNLGLVRYDSAFTPVDTLRPPTDPIERDRFELRRGEDMYWITSIPYTGGFEFHLSRAGTMWAMVKDDYRLFEFSADGDTLRAISRDFTPLPVTEADMEAARERLADFIRNGGKVDWSKIPDTKPAAEDFFLDDEGNVWVEPVAAHEEQGKLFDVFDPEGRFLGTVHLPFALSMNPPPMVRKSVLYGVTEDELEVPYVVRARIVKP